jgi:hypothetical protein
MIAGVLKLLAAPIAGKVLDIIAARGVQQVDRDKLRAEIEAAVIAVIADISAHQSQVIMAEIGAESWLQRNWRPVVAVTFSGIVLFYGLLLPVAVDWFGAPPVRIGDALLGWIMQAVLVCLGGYIGGRTVEKLARTLRSGR